MSCVNSCVCYLSIFIEDLITSVLQDDILFYLLLSIYSQRIYIVLEKKRTTIDDRSTGVIIYRNVCGMLRKSCGMSVGQ